jgi:hypothetical protein
MEGVISWPSERNNFSVRPGYADFGGHFIPRVTVCVTHGINWPGRPRYGVFGKFLNRFRTAENFRHD